MHSADDNISLNPQGKRWCFTWNNPPSNWKNILADSNKYWSSDNIKYLISEIEYAPSTGTKHLQGYFELKKKAYRNTLYNCWFQGYFILAKGTQQDNYKYCTKTGVDIFEIGEKTRETEKWCSNLNKVKKMLDDLMHITWVQFSDIYPIEALNKRSQLLQWKFDHQVALPPWKGELKNKNFWIWGPRGTGKSRWAREQFPPEAICFKWQNKWWEGYEESQHKMVLIEDMKQENANILSNYIKVWGDRYSISGEIKGGAIKLNPGKYFFIVTSNYCIKDCITNSEDEEAIKRRFEEVYIGNPNDIWLKTHKLNEDILDK